MNRLAHERSPYLLQHADNPVDWFPWGDDAFGKARAEQKPIFVSIGYSTCHWCHVMEHESFENAAVAAVLNEHFVSVKVDREERPDVDRVYMTFVQATTGSGGWPMSVWVTPELKPFYGGTYFPPTSRWGRPGFIEVLQEIARAWRVDRARIEDSAESVIAQLRGSDGTRPAADGPGTTTALPGDEALRRTTQQFRLSFDARNGGFGDAPKFPRPSELLFLLREYARTRGETVGEPGGEPGREPGGKDARAMALRTLQAMALGGMRDHVGGGFHRYSVDAKWRVPHFEKMLYDQAQLVLAFVEGAQAAGDPFYLEVAEDTLRYVMREMTDEAGGFYSAEDADSVPPEAAADPQAHKSEGAFYLWRDEEIDSLLGGAPAGGDAALVKARFGMAPGGNAPFDPQQEFTGKNLLYIARSVDDLAAEFNRPASDVLEALGKARFTMFRARLARPRPYLDDKVLTAWNGLMIAAFARAARVLAGRPGHEESAAAYLATADRAAAFIRSRMWDEAGRALLRRYRAGHAEIAAYAEDYAYLIFGLLELFQADPRPEWLEWAVVLQRRQDELFWDDRDGGWFSTTGTDPSVLVRMKEDYDGAEPSASSVAVFNLLVLSELVEEPLWRERIERTLRAFGTRLEQVGRGVPMMAAALSTLVAGRQQVIVVGEEAGPLMEVVSRSFLPFAVTLRLSDAQQQALSTALPLVGAMRPVGGHAAAYVCKNFTCRAPVTEPAALEQELASHA